MLRRALRRHHKQRMIAKTFRWMKDTWWVYGDQYTPVNDEILLRAKTLADNGRACSCWMCGNPRKYNAEKTLQEYKSDFDFEEQVMGWYQE